MARLMSCALKTRQFNSLGRGTDLGALIAVQRSIDYCTRVRRLIS